MSHTCVWAYCHALVRTQEATHCPKHAAQAIAEQLAPEHGCLPAQPVSRHCRACGHRMADSECGQARRCDDCQHNRRLSALRHYYARKLTTYWQGVHNGKHER